MLQLLLLFLKKLLVVGIINQVHKELVLRSLAKSQSVIEITLVESFPRVQPPRLAMEGNVRELLWDDHLLGREQKESDAQILAESQAR